MIWSLVDLLCHHTLRIIICEGLSSVLMLMRFL
uniref:Uncharacterized protein n=1 Tax=Arundo donax TaxID=35708 RepID=A0A0A9FYS9_ARUDO